MPQKNPLRHYVDHYAESLAGNTATLLAQHIVSKYCLVIPAYNEKRYFIDRFFSSVLAQKTVLVIVVINQPDTDNDSQQNQQLWDYCQTLGLRTAQDESYQLMTFSSGSQLLAINCFEHYKRLPAKQGVGLARKIGCDTACALIANKQITSPWIHTTDADSHLADDYFDNLPTDTTVSALTYPFQHIDGDNTKVNLATQLYEKSLHHYVNGLKAAGSPYAFYTLGSCMAVNSKHYAQARGFPKRAGGEDFYLLNKLAKLGKIREKIGKPIGIESRQSNRAPFGTGMAVNKIIEKGYSGKNYPVYNPNVFTTLKQVLEKFHTVYTQREDYKSWLNQFDPITAETLDAIHIAHLFKHINKNVTSEDMCLNHIHHWFDGFRTLKFLHELEKIHYKICISELT